MQRLGGFLISKIKQTQGRVMNQLLAEEKITAFSGEQGSILLVLWQGDGISQRELGKKTGLAKNTVTLMVEKLEKAGLISRRPCEKDRRIMRIYLTDYADSLKKDYDQISAKMGQQFYKGFSEQEIQEFEHYLHRIVSNLEEVSKS